MGTPGWLTSGATDTETLGQAGLRACLWGTVWLALIHAGGRSLKVGVTVPWVEPWTA